jgi:hypothetical protein
VDLIKQHYTKIVGKAVGKCNKFFKQWKKEPKSGWNEEKYIEEASVMYEDEEGKPYHFQTCVEVLHSVPKFDLFVGTG